MKNRSLPDMDRLSVLAAIILLAYALTRYMKLPVRDLSVQLPGLYLAVEINIRTFVALVVAGLTATGADWLLHDHPGLKNRSTVEHWMLPALTAWVIGIPLYQLPPGPVWWIVFAVGGLLLILVLIAEYIAVDPESPGWPLATAGLTAVSFALYLALAISLRYAGTRLFLLLPALTLAAGLVSLRTLHLRLRGRWVLAQAGIAAMITGEIAAGLHYWPLTPVSYGLLLLGPAYSLTSLFAGLAEGKTLRQSILEPGIVLGLVWLGGIWVL